MPSLRSSRDGGGCVSRIQDPLKEEFVSSSVRQGHLFYNPDDIKRMLGGIPSGQFDRVARGHGRKIGNSKYYTPDEVWDIREELRDPVKVVSDDSI